MARFSPMMRHIIGAMGFRVLGQIFDPTAFISKEDQIDVECMEVTQNFDR